MAIRPYNKGGSMTITLQKQKTGSVVGAYHIISTCVLPDSYKGINIVTNYCYDYIGVDNHSYEQAAKKYAKLKIPHRCTVPVYHSTQTINGIEYVIYNTGQIFIFVTHLNGLYNGSMCENFHHVVKWSAKCGDLASHG